MAEKGSDDQMTDEQREQLEARRLADEHAVAAEEALTADQPVDGDG